MIRLTMMLLSATLCHAEEPRHEFRQSLMGTRFTIVCHTADAHLAEEAAHDAFAVAREIERVASDYKTDSELLQLSAAPVGSPVKVSNTLFPILEAAFDIARTTDGVFDPTLGALTQLWRRTKTTGALPSPAELATAKHASGWRYITLDAEAQTITFAKSGMRLDLGGIAKGYAADLMLATMVKRGIDRTCIVAGGDVRAGAPPPDRDGWIVGIRTFDSAKTERKLSVSHSAVSTSGDLYQFVEIAGQRYSHILDPRTGLGLTERIAVSVIAPSATLSDALATAACVAGRENATRTAGKAGATRTMVSTP